MKNIFKSLMNKNNSADKEVDPIADYSVIPNDEEFANFLKLIQEQPITGQVGFWDPSTGKLGLAQVQDVHGVLLSAKDEWGITRDSILMYDNDKDTSAALKASFHQTQIHRLQALADLTDFKAADTQHLLSQITRGAFLEQEIPYSYTKDLFQKLAHEFEYEEILEFLKVFSDKYVDALFYNTHTANPDFIGFASLYLEKNPDTYLAHKVLLMLKAYLQDIPDIVDELSTALLVTSVNRIDINDAWDDGTGKNMGLLNSIENELSGHLYTISDNTVNFLKEKYSLDNITQMLKTNPPRFLVNKTYSLNQYKQIQD